MISFSRTLSLLLVITATATAQEEATNTLLDVANQDPAFLTFNTAIRAAGLEDTLNDTSHTLTVLIPENEAFEALHGRYLEPEWQPYLRALLEYHMIAWGPLMASSLSTNVTYPTLLDRQPLFLTEDDPLTFAQDAMVVNGNLEASNGIIHAVNALVLPQGARDSLLEQATVTELYSRFVDLIVQLDLTGTLEEDGPWTILMPTNEAFGAIPSAIFNGLSQDALLQVVLHHVIPSIQMVYPLKGSVVRNTLATSRTVTTLQGTSITLKGDGTVLTDDSNDALLLARLESTDHLATNGVWHSIDSILIPMGNDEIANADLGVVTAAPSSPGEVVVTTAPSSTATTTSSSTNTGVATSTTSLSTVVDEITTTTTTAPTSQEPVILLEPTLAPTAKGPTLMDYVRAYPDMSDLRDALELADLDTFLNEPGSYTLFVPTNSAFDSMPLKLYQPDWNHHLHQVLLYHVLPDSVLVAPVLQGMDLTTRTSHNDTLRITRGDPFTINGNAQVTIANTAASNGLLHVVDNLLLPPFVSWNVGQVVSKRANGNNLLLLWQLFVENNLMSVLEVEGPVTLLAPVDSSFSRTLLEDLSDMTSEEQVALLSYHVLLGLIPSEKMVHGATFSTLQGTNVTIRKAAVGNETELRVNNATILESNILANNGMIHLMDTVLMIPVETGDLEGEPVVATDAPTTGTTVDSTSTVATDAPSSADRTAAPTPGATMGSTMAETSPANDVAVDNTDTPTSAPESIEGTLNPTAASSEAEPMTIYDTINTTPEFSALATALRITGLDAPLSFVGSDFTLFAPSNEAFDAAPLDFAMYLDPEWKDHLANILAYHVLLGEVLSTDLSFNMAATTLQGNNMTVTSMDPVSIDGVALSSADLKVSNGVIHTLNEGVLLPPFATKSIVDLAGSSPVLSTFISLLTDTELGATLDMEAPFTVFAPTDEAFESVPSGISNDELIRILSYHVVPGIHLQDGLVSGLELTTVQGSTINVTTNRTLNTDSTIVLANVLANNGVIHIVDKVLIPDDAVLVNTNDSMMPSVSDVATSVPTETQEDPMLLPSIGEYLEDSAYSTLNALLKFSGVDTTVDMDGPWTVFGFSNSAYANSYSQILEGEELVCLLSNHIVHDLILSSDLFVGMSFQTLEGGNVTVTSMDPPTLMDENGGSSVIVLADVQASNGVFHGIDNLLVPIEESVFPTETPILVETEAPTSTTTVAESSSNTPELVGSTGKAAVCDDLISAYATVCCPIDDLAFASFCQDLFNRNNIEIDADGQAKF